MLVCIWFGASPVEGAGDGLFEVVWESDIDITMLVSRPSLRVVNVFVALVRYNLDAIICFIARL